MAKNRERGEMSLDRRYSDIPEGKFYEINPYYCHIQDILSTWQPYTHFLLNTS
jgi:hypothetical protein